MPAYRHTKTGVLILVDAHTATFLSDEWVADPLHGLEDPAPATETPEAVDETPVDDAPAEEAPADADGETTGTGAFAKSGRK